MFKTLKHPSSNISFTLGAAPGCLWGTGEHLALPPKKQEVFIGQGSSAKLGSNQKTYLSSNISSALAERRVHFPPSQHENLCSSLSTLLTE